MKKIGQTETELEADKMLECRNIVKNIVNFGVSEKQKIQLIKLISLELESRDSMKLILETVKKIYSIDEQSKFTLNSEETNYDKKPKLLDV